jgi:hypothetical protein
VIQSTWKSVNNLDFLTRIYFLITILFCGFLVSCAPKNDKKSLQADGDLELIKIDLSEAREGKLSEFFEPEIEYIWLKDDSEEAQLSAGLQKIFFHGDKILTLDIFGCNCIHIFDQSGNFISRIRDYGEGPGKYREFDDATIVNEELLLLGVYPPKLMWFSLDGKFLREEKLKQPVASGVYSENEKRLYFYSDTREPGEYHVISVDEAFQDTLRYLLYQEDRYTRNYPDRDNFIKNEGEVFLGRALSDTIWTFKEKKMDPKLVFDFGKYAQSIEELKKNSLNLDPLQELEFINKKAKLYFDPNQWYLTESQLYSGFKYEEGFYNVFFDRKNQKTSILKGRILDDLDGAFDAYSILYHFEDIKVGFKVPGRDLYDILLNKKEELGQKAFEEFVSGKGKAFSQVANQAKDSENPVLIVYSVKK